MCPHGTFQSHRRAPYPNKSTNRKSNHFLLSWSDPGGMLAPCLWKMNIHTERKKERKKGTRRSSGCCQRNEEIQRGFMFITKPSRILCWEWRYPNGCCTSWCSCGSSFSWPFWAPVRGRNHEKRSVSFFFLLFLFGPGEWWWWLTMTFRISSSTTLKLLFFNSFLTSDSKGILMECHRLTKSESMGTASVGSM